MPLLTIGVLVGSGISGASASDLAALLWVILSASLREEMELHERRNCCLLALESAVTGNDRGALTKILQSDRIYSRPESPAWQSWLAMAVNV